MHYANITCFDGVDSNEIAYLRTSGSTIGFGCFGYFSHLSEESMKWTIPDTFNTSSQTSDLSSKLNSVLGNGNCTLNGGTLNGTNCLIPFQFHSDTAGILQYSNLNINWTESVKPTIDFIHPTPNNSIYTTSNSFIINITGTEDNRNSAWVTLNNVNYSMDCIGTAPYYCSQTFSIGNPPDNVYTFYSGINDLAGNQNISETRSFVIDTVKPVPSFASNSESNGVNLSRNNIFMNVSITETNLANITINLYNSTGLYNSSNLFKGFCYQETANVSTSCGGLNTGSYYILGDWSEGSGISALYDGSYTTYASPANSLQGWMNITYQKPANALNSSLWRLKAPRYSIGYDQNYSIPKSCWDYSSTNITFMIYAEEIGTPDATYGCWNGTNLISISLSGIEDNDWIYEEGMYWDIANYINFTNLPTERYYVNATALDLAGNSNSTETRVITIDSVNPNAILNLPVNGTQTSSTSINFSINGTDNLSGIKNITLTVTNSSGVVNQTSFTISGALTSFQSVVVSLVSNVYNWFATIFDFSNNSYTSNNNTLIIDTILPIVSISYPLNTTYLDVYNYSINLNVSASDSLTSISSYKYSLNGASNISFTPNTTISGLIAGSNNLIVYANDSLNNVNSSSVTFYLAFTPKFNNITVSSNGEPNKIATIANFDGSLDGGFNTGCGGLPVATYVQGYDGLGVMINATGGDALACLSSNSIPHANIAGWTSYFYGKGFVRGYIWNGTQGITTLTQVNTNCSIGTGTPADIYTYCNSGQPYSDWTLFKLYTSTTTTFSEGQNKFYLYNKGNGTIGDNTASYYDFVTYPASYSRTDSSSLSSGLVGYWKLDENNTNQIDSSSYSNNGTVNGNATFTQSGKIGGAYYFPNNKTDNHRIIIPATPQLNALGNTTLTYSIALWMKSNMTLYGNQQYPDGDTYLINKRTGYLPYPFSFRISGNGVYWYTAFYNGSDGMTAQSLNHQLTDNNWHLLVATYNLENSTNYSIATYTDGVFDSISYGTNPNILINIPNLAQIELPTGGTDPYNGTLDEFRIYNKTLSANEVSSLYYITNPTFQEYAKVTISTTITDEDTSSNSLYYEWFVDGVKSAFGFAQNVFNKIFTGRSQIVKVNVNDSNNNLVSQSWNISTTFINPQISFASPTLSDGSNSSKTYIGIGLSVTESNFANITFKLFNNSNYLLNSTTFATSTTSFNFSNLADGTYKYNVSITDLVGNYNQTETRSIFLDATPPTTTASATSPAGVTAYTFGNWANTSVRVTLASFDGGIGFSNTQFPIYCIDTLNTCSPNTFIGSGVTDSTEGTSYIRYYANDTLNNTETIKSQTIKIDTTFPTIAFLSENPVNGFNVSQNYILVNISLSDSNFANMTYRLYNTTSLVNSTTYSGTAIHSILWQSLPDNKYYYNVTATDQASNTNSTETRIITLDTTNPSAVLNTPINNTYSNSASNNFTANLTDSLTGIKNVTINVIDSYPFGQFNGVDSYSLLSNIGNKININTNFTVGIWIKTEQSTAGMLFSSINTTSNRIGLWVGSPNTVFGQIYNGASYPSGANRKTSQLTSNTWNYITYVFDADTQTAQMFSNGNLDDILSSTTTSAGSSLNSRLGSSSSGASFYNGSMSNVAIFNRSLSSAEITTLYNNGRSPTNPITNGLVASYYLQGDVLDSSGNGNNGVNTGVTFSSIYSSTTTFSGTLSSTIGIVTSLIDGVYKWFYNLFDFSGNSYTSNNNTIIIDTTSPSLSFISPTLSSGTNISNNFILANISLTETNFANITFTLYNSTGLVNSSFYSSQVTYINWSNLPDSDYVYNVTVFDLVSQQTTITSLIRLDTNAPSGGLTYPSNNSYLNNSIHFNVTATDNLGIKNISVNVYNSSTTFVNSTTMTNSTTSSNSFSATFSGIADGIYSWFENVFDWAGNSFTSVIRTITLDSTYPSISFNPSTALNNSWQTTNAVLINASISDTNLNTKTAVFNGVSESFSTNFGDNYWVYNVVSNTGSYPYYITATDLAGNLKTSDTRIINVDLQDPSLTINNPLSQSYNYNTSLILSINASHIYLDSCIYNFDDGINSSINCNSQIAFGIAEGTHTVNVFANSSSGRTTKQSTNFIVSLTPPSVSLNHPLNGTWLNYNNIQFNYTVNSSFDLSNCQLYTNTIGSWSLNQTDNSPSKTSINTFNLNLSDGNYIYNILCTDTETNSAWGSPFNNVSFSVDTTNPLIDFISPTPINYYNTTSTSFTVSVSKTEINLANITFNLYNNLGLYNSSTFTDGTTNITYSSLPSNLYYYNVSIVDKSNNKNNTSTNRITIDSNTPSVLVSSPISQNYGNNNSISLNYSVSDSLVGMKDCWYYVYNSSGSLIIPSVDLASCQNTSFALPGGDINYILTVFGENNLNTIGSTVVNFGIRTDSPVITLDNPSNNLYINRLNNITFNFTATRDVGIDTCQFYNNFSGIWSLNQTITGITSGVNKNINTFNGFTESSHSWYVSCNDSLGNQGTSLINNTFILDITNPIVDIPVGAISLSQGSQTINFLPVVTDTNLDYCKFSIFNSLGNIDGLYNNVQFNCSQSQIATVSSFGTYNLTITAFDKASNSAWFTREFTTSPNNPTVGGGGGGSGGIPASKISVIGLNDINGTKKYTPLEREAIYASLNNYCSEKLRKGSFAVVDYSEECYLNNDDLNSIIQKLKTNSISIIQSDLAKFYNAFKNNDLFQGQEVQSIVDAYKLFTAKLGILNLLQLTPPSIDTLVLIKTANGNYTISYTVFSSKPLKSCEVISDNEDISCEVTNTTVKIKYLIRNTDFLSEIFSGVISVTTDASSDDIEQKRLSFNFRTYNFGYEPIKGLAIWVILALSVIVIPVSGTYLFKRKGRKIISQFSP